MCMTAVALAFEEMRTDEKLAYKRNRETNGAFQKHLDHHQTIQANSYWNVVRKRCTFPFYNTCMPSLIVCLIVWDQILLFAYAVCTASMILRTARLLCVLYPEFALTRPLAWALFRVRNCNLREPVSHHCNWIFFSYQTFCCAIA